MTQDQLAVLARQRAADLDNQANTLQAQVDALRAQRDLHNAAAQALEALAPEHKQALDALAQGDQ